MPVYYQLLDLEKLLAYEYLDDRQAQRLANNTYPKNPLLLLFFDTYHNYGKTIEISYSSKQINGRESCLDKTLKVRKFFQNNFEGIDIIQ